MNRRHLYLTGLTPFIVAAIDLCWGQNPVEMIKVTSLPGKAVQGQVLGANPADHRDWPSTYVFKGSQGQYCTASAVGPKVILTAAHCIFNDTTATVEVEGPDKTVLCNRHPAYPSRADFSLCFKQSALPRPAGGFERVNNDKNLLTMTNKLLLLGYGCVTKTGNRDVGSLYAGEADIITLASEDDPFIKTKGGAAVCFGDSGGGAYRYLDDDKKIRRLVGVNARGNIDTLSSLASTSTDAFIDWATAWAQKNSVEICGLTPQTEGCRL